MARFSAMFLPERSGFGLNELLGTGPLARHFDKKSERLKPRPKPEAERHARP